MDKEVLKQLKENSSVKYLYKVPSYWYPEKYLYIIVVDNLDHLTLEPQENIFWFSVENWFNMMIAGSPLVFACSQLKKRFKIKEYLSVYKKPNNLEIRKYLSDKDAQVINVLEADYGLQLIHYGQIFNFEVSGTFILSNLKAAYMDLISQIYTLTDSLYKEQLKEKVNGK